MRCAEQLLTEAFWNVFTPRTWYTLHQFLLVRDSILFFSYAN